MLRLRLNNSYAKMMVMIGFITLVPLGILPFYPEDTRYLSAFVIPGVSSIVLGCLLGSFQKESVSFCWKRSLARNSQVVFFVWMYGFLMGALPFVLSGFLPFVGAFFEAVSGYTTTGLSVMNVAETPHIFLFHRSFMQYVGGLGFVMMMATIVQEKNTANLYSTEGHPDVLMPNIKRTARFIWKMYLGFLLMGVILYQLSGMNLFESICHAMCSLSTGGFSTRLGSIGEYNNVMIELVTAFLMIIGTTNFAVLMLVVKGKWKQAFSVSEVKFMFWVIVISLPLVVINLCLEMQMDPIHAIRCFLVDGISAISTTGYSSMSYVGWPQFSLAILTVLMVIGGGAGSTAGGMKLSRVYFMMKMGFYDLKHRFSSSRSVECPEYTRPQGKAEITPSLMKDTVSFLSMYLVIYVTGSILLTLTANCSIGDALFEFASCLSTVGLSIGITNPATNDPTLIIETIGMILGRLEIFAVFTGCYVMIQNIGKFFSKKNATLF